MLVRLKPTLCAFVAESTFICLRQPNFRKEFSYFKNEQIQVCRQFAEFGKTFFNEMFQKDVQIVKTVQFCQKAVQIGKKLFSLKKAV